MSSHAHAHMPTAAEATLDKGHVLRKLPVPLAVLGVAGIALAFVTAGDDHTQFWFSYLTAYMFWLSAGLGALFFVLIHHGTRAGWSALVRRVAENWMITLPLLFLLGLPIVLGGLESLYTPWVNPKPDDIMVVEKQAWLNPTSFLIAFLICGGLWTAFSLYLYRGSRKQDASGDPAIADRLRWWAPLGYVTFGLTITVAAVNFMMSLDPHWYSTIFGVYYFGGTFMFFMAILSLSMMGIQRAGLLKEHVTAEHYQDIGKLAFAFVVFWSYIAFSQFMLIWYANIPEETLWFAHRAEGGWEWVTLLLALLHFAVPFFFLMSRHIKRRKTTMALGAILLVVAHLIDMFWIIQPTMTQHVTGHSHFGLALSDLLAVVGIGGLVCAVFFWRLGAAPVVVLNEPRMDESVGFENY
ncbi:MAG: hypothetical protein H6745_16135 [Deltaproteobacteria bacterium]|nr:hypothetical protein [Deltaproteobacteria bacterium]